MKSRSGAVKGRASNGPVVNRRAFLKGAGTVAIGLPFLEGLPERSAWAAGEQPVFTLLIVAQNGVVGKNFFPAATGALTTAGLAGAADRATAALSAHAANLLFIKGINYARSGPRSCGHAEGNVMALTGVAPGSDGNKAYSGGPSADVVIAKAVNPNGGDGLNLYSGAKGYIAERISFKAAGSGQVRAADVNPYLLYSKIVGLASAAPPPTTGTPTTPPPVTMDPVAAELVSTRKSVNDLVRAELNSLMNMSALSSADKQRLKQHFDAIRDMEVKMDGMAGTVVSGASCSKDGLATEKFEAMKSGFAFRADQMEEIVKLHLQATAVAFGCGYNRVAALQWGDGTDGTKYNVPSNSGLGWSFHQLSHRIMSDSASGNNPTAEAAHHEIDILRMQTLAAGLDVFRAHGLADKSMVVWTNSISDGPSHSTNGVPMIIWGNGGGFIKQGMFIDAAGTKNDKILNTIIAAAVRDKMSTPPSVGAAGLYAGMMA